MSPSIFHSIPRLCRKFLSLPYGEDIFCIFYGECGFLPLSSLRTAAESAGELGVLEASEVHR
jgi:hypothetical protein